MPKCRLCGKENLKTIYRQGEYRLVQCQECGFGSTDNLPAASKLKQLYQQGYHELISRNDYAADAQKKFSFVKQYLKPGRSWLDYGCGEGHLLNLIKQAGGEAWGYDISSAAAKTAKTRFGLRVKTGQLTADLFDQNQLEVITAFDVIEHIPEFRQVFAAWKQWLKPGGYVLLTTPDLDSWDARLFKQKWYGFNKVINYEHVNYFNRRSISLALEQAGMTIQRIQAWGFVRSLNYLAGKLLNRPVNWLPGQVYLPMTDMMVVAKKVSGPR